MITKVWCKINEEQATTIFNIPTVHIQNSGYSFYADFLEPLSEENWKYGTRWNFIGILRDSEVSELLTLTFTHIDEDCPVPIEQGTVLNDSSNYLSIYDYELGQIIAILEDHKDLPLRQKVYTQFELIHPSDYKKYNIEQFDKSESLIYRINSPKYTCDNSFMILNFSISKHHLNANTDLYISIELYERETREEEFRLNESEHTVNRIILCRAGLNELIMILKQIEEKLKLDS